MLKENRLRSPRRPRMGPSREIEVLSWYCAKGYSMGLVSSVQIWGKILESCDNCARSEKNWEMFSRHAEWPKVAGVVIQAVERTNAWNGRG